MDIVCAFFTSYLKEIYFLYGLAFFIMGAAVWLEASRSSVLQPARTLPFLAAFGMIHGGHEWVEMFQLMNPNPPTLFLQGFRLLALIISFAFLIEFGLRLLELDDERRGWKIVRWAMLAVFLCGMALVWAEWGAETDVWAAADAWCRYSLAVPGAVLAAVGLFKQGRRLPSQQLGISRDIFVIGLAFLLYGIPGQIFIGRSPLPPSTVLNNDLFMATLHFPIQLLRTVMAGAVAIFTVRALRLFELERQRQLDTLHQTRAEAQRQLAEEMTERERLQRALLRQTVLAQEEERRHIARELHDEASQAMTAISWQLAAVEQALPNSHGTGHGAVHQHVGELRQLTLQVMNNLRQLTSRLRPSVLDELGLVPALIAHADECTARFPFVADVEITGHRRRLPSEIETALYRITQEALTNVAKHAQAAHASIQLGFENEKTITLDVSDDGVGMDVQTAQRAAACGQGWGLAGIRERVQLVEGTLDIQSTLGNGTALNVQVPIPPPPPSEEKNNDHDPIAAGR